MSIAIRRKVVYLLAAATLALMLAGSTISAPVFADCNNPGSTACGG